MTAFRVSDFLDQASLVQASRLLVEFNASRVAALGSWPAWIPPESILTRLPDATSPGHGGFDAGVACCLGLIPANKQRLAASLHAAYTPELVAQVRKEIIDLSPDSETTWWLSACSVCQEGPSSEESFAAQLRTFEQIVLDDALRLAHAKSCLREMLASFELVKDVPMSLKDGGMQGAYIAGHELATAYDEDQDLYFIGTFHESLGLSRFPWSEPALPEHQDPERRLGRSGPVHGSRQFVKCATRDEFERALASVRLS